MAQDPRHKKYMESMAVLQLEAATKSFNQVVETAFRRCVHSFRSNELTGKEKKCLKNVTDSWMKFSQRAGMRFAEEQAKLQAQDAAEAAAKGTQ